MWEYYYFTLKPSTTFVSVHVLQLHNFVILIKLCTDKTQAARLLFYEIVGIHFQLVIRQIQLRWCLFRIFSIAELSPSGPWRVVTLFPNPLILLHTSVPLTKVLFQLRSFGMKRRRNFTAYHSHSPDGQYGFYYTFPYEKNIADLGCDLLYSIQQKHDNYL